MANAISIGIVGTHSTGKTTLAGGLQAEFESRGLTVARVDGLAEAAQKAGLPILRDHTFSSTLWIVATGIAAEIEKAVNADVVLVDRAVPDALAYLFAALDTRGEQCSAEQLSYLRDLIRHHSKRYRVLIRTELDENVALGDNKKRDDDADFRSAVDHRLTDALAFVAVPIVKCSYGQESLAIQEVLDIVGLVGDVVEN